MFDKNAYFKKSLKNRSHDLIIINSHEKILDTYSDSVEYLKNNDTLNREIILYLRAYYEIQDLIPQTIENIGSGHFFPFSESNFELENSYQLCMEGFYSYAFAALRSVLELGLLGIYFDYDDKAYENVKPWISTKNQTPPFKNILKRLEEIECFNEFDQRFDYIKKTKELYYHLSGYIHTRGFRYSSTSKTYANFNRFNEKALIEYSKFMFSVVSNVIAIMLIKYPIGVKCLPLYEKFGLYPPFGGFLDHQVIYIKYVVPDEMLEFIEKIAEKNTEVQRIVDEIEALPDLTEEELEKQCVEFDKNFGNKLTK